MEESPFGISRLRVDFAAGEERASVPASAGSPAPSKTSLVEEARALTDDQSLVPSDEILGLIDERVWQLSRSLRRVTVELAQGQWVRPADHLHALPEYSALSEDAANDLDDIVRRFAPVHMTPGEIPLALAWYRRVFADGLHEDTEYLELVSLLGFDRWVEGVEKTYELYPQEIGLSEMDWGDDASWQIVFGVSCPVKEYLK